MTFKNMNFIIFSITLNLYFIDAIDFNNDIFKSDSNSPIFPSPSSVAIKCMESKMNALNDCKTDARKHWNITQKSPVNDLCCAQWDVIHCDLSAAKENCNSEELSDVNEYLKKVIEYYDSTKCNEYPKNSSQCAISITKMLERVSKTSPPIPPPLCIDCIANIKYGVRRECQILALKKWHISKRSPIKNICCAAWDDLDCLSPIVPVRCPPSEVDITINYFNQVIDWAVKEACSSTPYHSTNCTNASITEMKSEISLNNLLPFNLENEETNQIIKDTETSIPLLSLKSPTPPPTPPPLCIDCIGNIKLELRRDCRFLAIKKWNIHKRSPIKNICCASWDNFDCLSPIVPIRCPASEANVTKNYITQIIDWADKEICSLAQYHSSNCTNASSTEIKSEINLNSPSPTRQENDENNSHILLPIPLENEETNQLNNDTIPKIPILLIIAQSPPPTENPLYIDCMVNIKWGVRQECEKIALQKWHIHKKSPIKNICCATWDILDCLIPIVPIRCPNVEVNVSLDYFKQLEVWAEKVACSQAQYHSSNCTNASISDNNMKNISPNGVENDETIQINHYILLPIPFEKEETNKINKDYSYFLLEYMQSAFPYLLQLMIFLAIILVTVVVIQFYILFRQSKQNHFPTDLVPNVHEYQKLNI